MPKRIQRQYTNTNRMDQDYQRDIANRKSSESKQNSGLDVDTAKALVEAARANMANQQLDQEILVMLKQINDQLKQLQPQQSGEQNQQSTGQQQLSQQGSGQNQQGQTQQNQNQQEQFGSQTQQKDALVSEELNRLFSQLLKNKQGQGQQQSSNQQQQGQQAQGGQSEQSNQPAQNQNSSTKSKNGAIAVQTAAQVLAEAQYELANELDASLKKLKQVISESEKIANKISNLLGEGNTTNKQ